MKYFCKSLKIKLNIYLVRVKNLAFGFDFAPSLNFFEILPCPFWDFAWLRFCDLNSGLIERIFLFEFQDLLNEYQTLSTNLSEEVESLNNCKRELEESIVSCRDSFVEERNNFQSEISKLKSANADAALTFAEAERQFKVISRTRKNKNQ